MCDTDELKISLSGNLNIDWDSLKNKYNQNEYFYLLNYRTLCLDKILKLIFEEKNAVRQQINLNNFIDQENLCSINSFCNEILKIDDLDQDNKSKHIIPINTHIKEYINTGSQTIISSLDQYEFNSNSRNENESNQFKTSELTPQTDKVTALERINGYQELYQRRRQKSMSCIHIDDKFSINNNEFTDSFKVFEKTDENQFFVSSKENLQTNHLENDDQNSISIADLDHNDNSHFYIENTDKNLYDNLIQSDVKFLKLDMNTIDPDLVNLLCEYFGVSKSADVSMARRRQELSKIHDFIREQVYLK